MTRELVEEIDQGLRILRIANLLIAKSYPGTSPSGRTDVQNVPHAGGGIVRPRIDGSVVVKPQLAIECVDDVRRLAGEMRQIVVPGLHDLQEANTSLTSAFADTHDETSPSMILSIHCCKILSGMTAQCVTVHDQKWPSTSYRGRRPRRTLAPAELARLLVARHDVRLLGICATSRAICATSSSPRGGRQRALFTPCRAASISASASPLPAASGRRRALARCSARLWDGRAVGRRGFIRAPDRRWR